MQDMLLHLFTWRRVRGRGLISMFTHVYEGNMHVHGLINPVFPVLPLYKQDAPPCQQLSTLPTKLSPTPVDNYQH